MLPGESTTGGGIFLEAGLDTDADTLLEGDLGIDADILLEELNIGSGFMQIAARKPLH
jgi:hypothetical protein